MIYLLRKEQRKVLFSLLIFIAFMLIWRMMRQTYNSSRYSANLYVFGTVGSAYFLCYWYLFFKNLTVKKEILQFVGNLLKALVIIVLFLKFFHYNPYSNYNKKIIDCIKNEKTDAKSVIISMKAQYPYSVEGIPQVTAPKFLSLEENDFLLNTIKHYQLSYETLYIVSDLPLEKYSIPENYLTRISLIGSFQKNRHGRKSYVFKYLSPGVDTSLKATDVPFVAETPGNLFKNSGFEIQRQYTETQSYYEKIQNSKKKGVIPDNKFFPNSWDIFWGEFDAQKPAASVFIYSENHNAISGQYSLAVKNHKTASFLHEASFPKGEYLFQCDILPASKCSFGLQFSLRDQKGEFYGMRELKRISLDTPNQLYHYKVKITSDMIAPFQRFYLYFFSYEQGDFLIDNVYLTEIIDNAD